MTRIEDVARRAGVSTATISRVLSGKGYVGEELRERVLATVREMNYSPNGVARSMAQRKTHTLGLIVSDITNPFFTVVARGVEDVGQQAGYSVVLCNTDEKLEKEQSYLAVLREKRVDGVLLAISSDEVAHVQRLIDGGMRLVLIDRAASGIDVPLVQVDGESGVHEATRYLLALGHRRIAMITGILQVTTAKERLRGYEGTLHEAGVSLDPALVVSGGFTERGGYEAGVQLCAIENRPTAVISSNNVMTTGLLLALRNGEVRIPDDISVISFDDLPYFSLLDRPLTAISQPMYELGQRACELLLRVVQGDPELLPEEKRIRLPTTLLIRESCQQLGQA